MTSPVRFTIRRRVDFCYGHRLPDHKGKCRQLHGHNGIVEVRLEATELDPGGMVADFGDVGRAVKGWIDAHLDHRMILRRDDPLAELLRHAGEPVVLMEHSPTAEVIARAILEAVRDLGLPVTEVRLWETPTSIAIASRG